MKTYLFERPTENPIHIYYLFSFSLCPKITLDRVVIHFLKSIPVKEKLTNHNSDHGRLNADVNNEFDLISNIRSFHILQSILCVVH